jgi:phosphohistidine swiveling domain-containing protein
MSLEGERDTVLVSPTWPIVTGLAGRPGQVVRGRARVAGSTGAAPRLEPGTVLVVDRLPAAWVPMLESAAAVVAETGGVLSNAATLLRERGIPAVFGVDGATRALRDGEVVDVDPVQGVVSLVGPTPRG